MWKENRSVCEELRNKSLYVLHAGSKIENPRSLFCGYFGKYTLWWLGNDAGSGGVIILVKKEISGNIVGVGRKSDKVMAIVLALGREVIRILCASGPQSSRPDTKKGYFSDEVMSEQD